MTERFSGPSPEEMQAAPQPAPPPPAEVQQSATVQAEARPENGPPPPGWSVEEIAQNKALAQGISQIEDPEQRAEAQRLLSEIKQEAAGLAASREPEQGKDKGLDLEP